MTVSCATGSVMAGDSVSTVMSAYFSYSSVQFLTRLS
jgi:hypothetical protein